jgi:hypothetical protein
MATQYLGAGTFVANSALTAFRAVVISNNRGVGLAATAGSVDGITQIDAASGDFVTVAFLHGQGTQKISLLAGPTTVGDTLYIGANGLAAITGTVVLGKTLTTATEAGAILEFIPKLNSL